MAEEPNAVARIKAPRLKGSRPSVSGKAKWHSNIPIPSTANVTAVWVERMMPRQELLPGFRREEDLQTLWRTHAKEQFVLCGSL